jgi:serine/threonine protein kinase
MHDRRVMHRDLKPANVFITTQGMIKLGDLGLGRFFAEGTVQAHSLVGTPYYMSPERLAESGYSFGSDIWGCIISFDSICIVGCLLYELAALHSPFYAEKMNLAGLVKKIDDCDYPPLPSELYSKEMRDLISGMIVNDPEKRLDATKVYTIAKAMYEKTNAK